MGNFYTNYTVRTTDQKAVAATLHGRAAFVSSVDNDCVVVFDEESEEQDIGVIRGLASCLSRAVRCPVLAVVNHDDDILAYFLFDNGVGFDEYDSTPDYFEGEGTPPSGGDAQKICSVFGSSSESETNTILHDSDYVFAFERHEALASALGLPKFTVGNGFNAISGGNFLPGFENVKLLKTD